MLLQQIQNVKGFHIEYVFIWTLYEGELSFMYHMLLDYRKLLICQTKMYCIIF